MSQTRAEGTFEVASFDVVDIPPAVAITTAMETGVATMEKRYAGRGRGPLGDPVHLGPQR